MGGRWRGSSLRLVAALVLSALLPLALGEAARAQQGPPSAELTRVVGRVEILRKGQSQWIPAVVGARLVEGDDIRAFAGAQAELALPDTSTVQLAENSRLLMTKLEYNAQQQSRFVLLHLAVGKVRAAIAQAAITLVRARQSNFAISTPTAVAAARGTVVWIAVIPVPGPTLPGAALPTTRTLIAVEPEPGLRIVPRIECIPVARPTKRVMVYANFATTATQTECAPPTPTPPGFMTFSNPATAGTALLSGPVSVPGNIEELVTGFGPDTGPSFTFGPTGPLFGQGPPSSLGRDTTVNQQNLPQCATTGATQTNCRE
jgi:hypothetical protein